VTSFVLNKLQWFMFDLPPGPRFLPLSAVVNLQKVGMPFYLSFLMWYYGNFSVQMVVYACLHGLYGLLWYLKHLLFRDKVFDEKCTFSCALVCWLFILGPYMVPAWLIASGISQLVLTPAWLYFWVAFYAVGVTLTFGSDYQKNTTLAQVFRNPERLKKKDYLISEGFFRRTRNPNFLGEMMIYLTFAAICGHWIAYAIVLWSWVSILALRMFQKEMSLMLKPGYALYSQESWILLPKINGRAIDSVILYSTIATWFYIFIYQA